MKTLAIDTTCAVASAAIISDGRLLCEYTVNSGNTHSVTLLPMILSMLENTHLNIDDIDLFAASVGPGSFTGVRIGVATIKGLAFEGNIPCVPVSSLAAMAENLSGLNGIIVPCINARRNQVYTALFKSENGVVTRISDDTTLLVSELEELLLGYENIWFTGDAYDMVSYMTSNITPKNLRNVSAYGAAVIGERIYSEAEDKSIFTDEMLMPLYLKKPQAEREREEKLELEKKNNG